MPRNDTAVIRLRQELGSQNIKPTAKFHFAEYPFTPELTAVDSSWSREFHSRMADFERARMMNPGHASLSIKVRITSGCYHREHSPEAYKLIDKALADASDRDFAFIEHESGPEILTIVADSLSIVASVAAIIAVIIDARSKGIKRGDDRRDPLELVVRRVEDRDSVKEETVLRISHAQEVSEEEISKLLNAAASRLLSPELQNSGDQRKKAGVKPKRRHK